MKKVLSIFTIVSIFSLSAKDFSNSINTINHQKVLTQEILKEYSFKGMGNNFSDSKDKLSNKLKAYNRVSKELSKIFSDKESKKYIKASNKIWSDIEIVFKSKALKSEVLMLQKKTDKILNELSKLMKIALSKNNASRDSMVNISGYQAVIIERMSALYMMKTWGINDPKFNFKMRESITFFNNSLNKLIDSPKTDEENQKTIKLIMRHFKFFEIMNASKTKYIPTLIYAKTNKIHKYIDKITQRYIIKGK